MTASIENIVQHLFHQPSLQYVSVDELETMTQEYPSFAAARFLLLKKMQETDHPGFADQLHKTSVYFNNPLWLQLLLAPQKDGAVSWHTSNGASAEPPPLPYERAYETAPVPVDEAPVDETPVFDEAPADDAVVEEAPAEPIHIDTPLSEDPLFKEVLDRLRGQIQEAGEQQMPEPEEAPAPPVVPAEIEEHIPQQETNHQDSHPEFPAPEPEPQAPELSAPPEITSQEEQQVDDDVMPFADPEPLAEVPVFHEPAVAPPAEELPSIKIIIETPSSNHDVLFEPYHTIDYFASQGIKLDKIDPQPQDKLGRQLKSFTEWLKSMRKLPQVSIEQVLAENEESAVVASASDSVVGKDVITEAMAEVFEKQGLHYKAAEVYNKLSLLNPSKSAYFADKINALKR